MTSPALVSERTHPERKPSVTPALTHALSQAAKAGTAAQARAGFSVTQLADRAGQTPLHCASASVHGGVQCLTR